MTPRALRSQLPAALVSTLGAALGEALGCGLPHLGQAPLFAARLALWTLGLWALPSLVAALALAAALAVLCGEASLGAWLRLQWRSPKGKDALLVGMVAGSAVFAWLFVAGRATTPFHNRELAALLGAAVGVGGAAVLALVALEAYRRAQRARAAGRRLAALPGVALALNLMVLGSVLWVCRAGFAQLDPRLLAAPAGFLSAFAAAERWAPWRALGRFVPPVAAAAWALLLLAGEASPVARSGSWSKPLIAGLQRATDFDGDGYSGFLGGGDCAPFDGAVGPAAAEKPGDGVDNNCVAGDAGRAAQPRRPRWGASAHGALESLNVVIVTIETLRHDHTSLVNAERDTTPTLRRLANEALVFERMYSASSFTRLSVPTLFSSYAPSEIDWQRQPPEKRMRRLGARTPWLPELLRARGYETIAVLTDFSAFTPLENAGFDRGFQHYDISTKLEYRGGTMWGFPAEEQVDKALGYLARAQKPFLLWLHLFEPHYRYEQPPGAPVFGTDEQARYDAEIWHADHQLGRLVDGLRQQGVWDRTVLLVTGDHGEAFGEHGDRWHGTNLYEPQLRPAALLRVPGVTGKRVATAVTFSDLAPTLFRVLGDRASFDKLRGRSLAPLFHHGALPADDDGFVAETFAVDDGRAYQAAWIAYPLKLIYVETGRTFTLFDLSADPGEQHPLDPTSDPRAAPLMRELVSYLERARSTSQ